MKQSYIAGSVIFLRAIALLVAISSTFGCAWYTGEDLERVRRINEDYRGVLKLELESDVYAMATDISNDGRGLDEDVTKEVFEKFFFADESRVRLRKTAYFYLNVYSSSRRFQYQLCFDSTERKIVKGYREYE